MGAIVVSMEQKLETKTVSVTKDPVLSYGLVVALSVIWGLAFVAIRRAGFELSPVNLTVLRWLVASAGFLILAPFYGRPRTPIQRSHIPRILLVSFASVMGYHLSLNYAERLVSSGLAGLLISFAPIFVVILSSIFLKEKISGRLILALGSGIAGAIVLSAGSNLSFQQITGPAAVVLAAFMYSVFSVGSKPLVKEYGAFPVAIWLAAIGTAFTLPLLSSSLIEEAVRLSIVGWISVLYLAVVSTVVANVILYTLISSRSVSRLSIQLYLVPVVSLVGGIVLLGEILTVFTVVGAAFLFAGVALATRKH